MKKVTFKISGVGVRPAGKNGMVIRVRFENGDVVTLTGKQVRYMDSLAKVIRFSGARRRHLKDLAGRK